MLVRNKLDASRWRVRAELIIIFFVSISHFPLPIFHLPFNPAMRMWMWGVCSSAGLPACNLIYKSFTSYVTSKLSEAKTFAHHIPTALLITNVKVGCVSFQRSIILIPWSFASYLPNWKFRQLWVYFLALRWFLGLCPMCAKSQPSQPS